MMSLEEFVDCGDSFGEVLDAIFAEVCVSELYKFSDLFGSCVFGYGDESYIFGSAADAAGGFTDAFEYFFISLFEW